MRVTNSMISNSARSHIMNAKSKLLMYEEQYTTEKKIQRPSDDPTVAVRSLKYRSSMAQITQYVEKNVQDAMAWMDTTESAMKNINSILINMKGYLDQGANDYLAMDERNAVLSTLEQYVSAVFEDEANADYSGRYVFSGYRTDTSLIFGKETKNLSYEILENFQYSDVESVNVITGGAVYDENITDGQDYIDMAPSKEGTYRIQLAYRDCSNSGLQADGSTPTGTKEDYVKFSMSYKNADGDVQTDEVTAVTRSSSDDNAYEIGDDEIVYMYDTGEIYMGKNVYDSIQQKEAAISVTYCKTEFTEQDIRPEMYFECSSYDSVSKKKVKYAEPSEQNINYEINFSQTMTVNTQARDAVSTDIYRAIDHLRKTIEEVDDVENRIADVEKKIANSTDAAEIETLTQLQETLVTERSLRVTIMTEAFGKGLTMVDTAQEKLNVAVARLGTRYNRLELTYNKLSDQKVDTEEALSDNEDVDLADAYINLTQADNLYQYSLSSTSKILGNSLLDYI